MSKITPFLQEVVYLVADLLTSLDHNKQAQKLKKQFELPQWVKKDNPLIKKGLKKIIKQYINSNQKVLKYFQSRKPQSEQQEQPEQQQTPKPTKKSKKSLSPKQSPLVKPKSPKISGAVHQQPKGWMISQFQQPKRLQDLNQDYQQAAKQQPQVDIPKKDKKSKKQVKKQSSSQQQSSQQQTPKPKKQKKQIKKQKKQTKVKGPVDSSYLNSEQQFQLQDKKTKRSVTPQKVDKKQQPIQTRKKSAQIQKVEPKVEVKQVRNNNHIPYQNRENNGYNNGPKKFFSRINEDEVGFIPQNRRDNTFEAKARYGAGDAWGQFGYEKLKQTRGDSFKKTKGKLKNKAFQGSGININQVNSIPIL